MTVIVIAALAALCLYLHARALNQARNAFEDRVNHLHDRHANALRKLIEGNDTERAAWHKTLTDQTSALVAQLEQERRTAADERVQLLNRIKPDTYQPPLSQPDASGMVPPVGFEDDDAYRSVLESRDELVERLEREMQAARVAT